MFAILTLCKKTAVVAQQRVVLNIIDILSTLVFATISTCNWKQRADLAGAFRHVSPFSTIELVALHVTVFLLSYDWLFLAVSWVVLWSVIVAFPGRTHLLFILTFSKCLGPYMLKIFPLLHSRCPLCVILKNRFTLAMRRASWLVYFFSSRNGRLL